MTLDKGDKGDKGETGGALQVESLKRFCLYEKKAKMRD